MARMMSSHLLTRRPERPYRKRGGNSAPGEHGEMKSNERISLPERVRDHGEELATAEKRGRFGKRHEDGLTFSLSRLKTVPRSKDLGCA